MRFWFMVLLIAAFLLVCSGCQQDTMAVLRHSKLTVWLDFDATETVESAMFGYSSVRHTLRPYKGDRTAIRARLATLLDGTGISMGETGKHRVVVSESLGPHGALGTDGIDWLSAHPESIVFVMELRKRITTPEQEAIAIANVAAHEIGHQAGLWHDPREGVVMSKHGGGAYGTPWKWVPDAPR